MAAQRTLQSSVDVLLGWTNIDGRSYFVRQMKNMKGSIPVEWLVGKPFNEYPCTLVKAYQGGHGRGCGRHIARPIAAAVGSRRRACSGLG